MLKRLYPKLPVYINDATARITLPMLLDAARVGQRNGSPMFSEQDVVNALQNVTVFQRGEPFEIEQVTLTARQSGHILGAVGIKLKHQGGFSVWHTADFNTVATPTTDAAHIPPVPEPVDAVVSETTYGTLSSCPTARSRTPTFSGRSGRYWHKGAGCWCRPLPLVAPRTSS